MKKSEQIAEMILERIDHGCYHTGILPSLRELAAELNVNYLTVRQGLHLLSHRGVVGNSHNRRFSILKPQRPVTRLNVALLEGAGGGINFITALTEVAGRYRGNVRRFIYSYKNDELLTTVPDRDFDLIFFHIPHAHLSPMLLDKFAACREKLVSLSFDYTRYGIRSILEPSQDPAIATLFRMMDARGHQRYDILAPQDDTNDIREGRIRAFRLAAEAAGKVCNTHRYQMPDFLFDVNLTRTAAHQTFTRSLPPDGVFVPTIPHAIGVMRGLFDLGWLAGRDYSLVSYGDKSLAINCIPAIATATSEDFGAAFETALQQEYDPDHLAIYLMEPEVLPGESLIKA